MGPCYGPDPVLFAKVSRLAQMARIQRWQYHANDNTYGMADHRDNCGNENFSGVKNQVDGISLQNNEQMNSYEELQEEVR
ncbi:Tho Complex Subunit 2 [Manis pentadactyla]|nr:Tho Complex Subunit 2 [Manis pentadactyla]